MRTPASRPRAKPSRRIFKPRTSPRTVVAGGCSYSRYVQEFSTYVGDDLDGLCYLTVGSFAFPHHLALPEAGPSPATIPDEPLRHLYALQVEDLLEFTTDDLVQAWACRSHSCGSKEAAAEMYALVRVLDGIDEFYAGASAYLDHPEVMAIFAVADQEELTYQVEATAAPVPDAAAANSDGAGLTLAAVSELTLDELRKAWDNRPESFASLEAAAETLAILRSLNAEAPEKPSYLRMLQHELVLDLEDALPSEIQAQVPAPVPAAELALLKVDRRAVRSQVAVIRPGQANFRTAMLERYGGECCITGCTVDTLLEAAHIIPYRGDQTNDVTNGLLLRVDVHRLFDAHLVTINPRSLSVEVASSVNDAGYQAYHGKRLFAHSPKPRILFLEAHYQAYEKARIQTFSGP